jgi:hypothetical protein
MIDYDRRRFRPVEEKESGRVAVYRQEGDLLWGEFAGGHALRGTLVGTRSDDDSLDFAYGMVLDDGEVVSGRCHSVPEVLADGRIRLRERWERYGPHGDRGVSLLEEI